MGVHEFDGVECVVFDVGETLIDEIRLWTELATRISIPAFTVMGVLGALIERGIDHRRLWEELEVPAPSMEWTPTLSDVYPDAAACVDSVRRAGLRVGVAGNQPAGVGAALAALGFEVDVTFTSSCAGVAKPHPRFFERLIDETGVAPSALLYVGDRLDNDILPARAAGMRTAHVRRGPWGLVHSRWPQAELADLRLHSLTDLQRILERRTDSAV